VVDVLVEVDGAGFDLVMVVSQMFPGALLNLCEQSLLEMVTSIFTWGKAEPLQHKVREQRRRLSLLHDGAQGDASDDHHVLDPS
jgi:hypothetical protein